MRRLSTAAALAVPLLLFAADARANPPAMGFGCGDHCLRLFRGIHQHGPLFNYGPYYGYYPFAPYGPWDQYLRYDPNFYGDGSGGAGGRGGRFAGLGGHLHGKGCNSCGFFHASWLQGGWFRGHNWLHGNKHSGHQSACSSCGGVATPAPREGSCCSTLTNYSAFGAPAQSAAFYAATPTLNPALDLPAARR